MQNRTTQLTEAAMRRDRERQDKFAGIRKLAEARERREAVRDVEALARALNRAAHVAEEKGVDAPAWLTKVRNWSFEIGVDAHHLGERIED